MGAEFNDKPPKWLLIKLPSATDCDSAAAVNLVTLQRSFLLLPNHCCRPLSIASAMTPSDSANPPVTLAASPAIDCNRTGFASTSLHAAWNFEGNRPKNQPGCRQTKEMFETPLSREDITVISIQSYQSSISSLSGTKLGTFQTVASKRLRYLKAVLPAEDRGLS